MKLRSARKKSYTRVKSPNSLNVDDIESLELEITAVVQQEGQLPLELKSTRYIHFRENWQGPQLIKNRRFTRGMQHWTISRAKSETGFANVFSGQLIVDVAERRDNGGIKIVQDIGYLRTNTNYRFSLKAQSVDSANEITIQFTGNDGKPKNIVVDGKTEFTHRMKISPTMELISFDFKIEGQSGWAWLNIGCDMLGKLCIDDISLRKVIDPLSGL